MFSIKTGKTIIPPFWTNIYGTKMKSAEYIHFVTDNNPSYDKEENNSRYFDYGKPTNVFIRKTKKFLKAEQNVYYDTSLCPEIYVKYRTVKGSCGYDFIQPEIYDIYGDLLAQYRETGEIAVLETNDGYTFHRSF